MATKMFEMDGPVPGENYTSDTKNYPWHRPPEFTKPDEAIDYLTKMFMREEASASVIGMLELQFDIVTITDLLITKGIAQGKWAVDLGLIIAGPVSHMLVIMAKGFDVPYQMGLKKNITVPDKELISKVKNYGKPTKEEKKAVQEQLASFGSSGLSAPMGFAGGMDGMPPIEDMEEVTEPMDNPMEEQTEGLV